MAAVTEPQTTSLLSVDNIKKNVLPLFNIHGAVVVQIKVKNTDKQRSVYKVTYGNKNYCLKKVYYNLKDLLFIYSATEWFFRNNIKVPKMLPSKDNKRYVLYKNMFFILTPWISGIKASYDDDSIVVKSAENLGKMHRCSINFFAIDGSNVKSNCNDLQRSMVKHFKSLLTFANKAFKSKDKFSKTYIDHLDEILSLSKTSTETGYKVNYKNLIVSLCHGDYVAKNLLIDDNDNLWVIDFDKTKVGYRVQDLTYAMRRYMRRTSTNWNMDKFLLFVETYEKELPLNEDEYNYLLSYLAFPQKLWRLARDYYNLTDKTLSGIFEADLIKCCEDLNAQTYFIEDLQLYINKKFKRRKSS
ncbi:CotS family spore coat protein [Clostridium cellulovorans]|uniref:Spore coat protein, CotS family n=1 Tax=Clostridium cellulovorans (strain ATCC 35296 / DSM 3052 / OCM 3 / 743B) TaxID=573061 RepID=D9SW65_CLOC7|nr:CotS family spore coat protein [Clostridium cellulovorans]ADL51209.1 spore coat protein, CotS family [Clostridium cellulovorans 743B]